MPDTHDPEVQAAPDVASPIPRWTPDFDVNDFDVQAALREATAQKKSVGKLLKSLGYPVAKLISQEALTFKSAEGIPATASSTAVDLAGDQFDAGAVRQMKAAALGTTVFLNHQYDVPEDVFGKVAGCEVVKRNVLNQLTGRDEEHYCLDLNITPVGEDENPRAVRVANMLRKSQLKLGVSVTVLVLRYKEREGGGRLITHVFYLESSMVGIPCNQTAWVNTDTDSKSFSTAPAEAQSETSMTEQQNATTAAVIPASPTTAGGPGETKVSFLMALATAKAMFADVLHENQNNFWLYVDSLRTVYSRLKREARGKGADAVAALVEEGNASVDEFAAELKKLLAEEITEASTQESSSGCYYDYWSAIGRLQGVVQKAGARNSQADQSLLNKAHDCLVEAGAQCAHETTEVAGGGEAKTASVIGAPDQQARITELEEQLEAALQAAELASKELELEKATSIAAVEALEELSREPLPRAGA